MKAKIATAITVLFVCAYALLTAAAQSITEYPLPNQAGNVCIAPGDTSLVWYTDQGGNSIDSMTSNGAISEHLIPTANAGPVGCEFGPDGRLYFAEQTSHKIGAFNPASGQFTEYPIAAPNSGMAGVVFDGNGVLDIMVTQNSVIQRMQTDGTFLPYINLGLVNGATKYPHGPVYCGGSVWFAEHNYNHVARLDLDGTFYEKALPQASSKPFSFTCAPDGPYFTENGVGKIGHVVNYAGALSTWQITQWNTSASTSQPMGIAYAPNGLLYWSESTTDNIGSMLDGSLPINETSVPTPNAEPNKVTACFTNAVCFSERGANQLGVLNY